MTLSEQVETALTSAGFKSHVHTSPGYAYNTGTGSGLGTFTLGVAGEVSDADRPRLLDGYEEALRKAGLRVARSTHCVFVSAPEVLGE